MLCVIIIAFKLRKFARWHCSKFSPQAIGNWRSVCTCLTALSAHGLLLCPHQMLAAFCSTIIVYLTSDHFSPSALKLRLSTPTDSFSLNSSFSPFSFSFSFSFSLSLSLSLSLCLSLSLDHTLTLGTHGIAGTSSGLITRATSQGGTCLTTSNQLCESHTDGSPSDACEASF